MDNPYKNRMELYERLVEQERWMDATRLAFDTPPTMNFEDISVIVRFNEVLKQAVLVHRPNAVLMHVENKQHEIESVGIFDLSLILNHRLNFRVQSQKPPQQISLLFQCKENWDEKGKQVIYQDAWTSALHRMLEQSEELRILWNTRKWHSPPRQ